jgi:hypothetical protein
MLLFIVIDFLNSPRAPFLCLSLGRCPFRLHAAGDIALFSGLLSKELTSTNVHTRAKAGHHFGGRSNSFPKSISQ